MEPVLLRLNTAAGQVSALGLLPAGARALAVLAHGAGAGMRHPFLEAVTSALATHGIGTFRYQFPYMEAGRSRTDTPAVAADTVRRAVEAAARFAPGLPLVAGGKSFGGRMTAVAAAQEPLPAVRGLVFLGFPLHPPKRSGTSRAESLGRVALPMLFLQGTRDDFADLELIRQVVDGLGGLATLHVIDEANHGFEVPKRTGRSHADVIAELAATTASWIAGL